jgi:hypothetical protein
MLSENCHIHATLSATAGRAALSRIQTNPEVVHCSIVGEESKRGAELPLDAHQSDIGARRPR